MINDTLDADLYIHILKEDLRMSLDELEQARGEFILQHDDNPSTQPKFQEFVHPTETAGTLL